MTLAGLLLAVGVVAGFLAAAMAWLITYQEYAKHYFPDRAPAVRAATQAAAVTWLLFVLLAAGLGWALPRVLATPDVADVLAALAPAS